VFIPVPLAGLETSQIAHDENRGDNFFFGARAGKGSGTFSG